MQNIIKSAGEILFPRQCPVCRKVQAYGKKICPACARSLSYVEEPVCFQCGKPISSPEQELCFDCRIFPKSFHGGRSVFLYNNRIKPAMMDFKYKNRRILADFFIGELVDRQGEVMSSWGADMVVPVPVHRNKRKKRGYNQAELLSKVLADRLNLSHYPNLLIRTQDTLPQKMFSPQARLNNLQKAFRFNQEYKHLCSHNASAILIDDIYTTGATMEACSRLLLAAGLKKVYICSICIGVARE